MKILKHGSLTGSTYRFECGKCGCVYTAEEYELQCSYESACIRYRYTNCPECQNRIATYEATLIDSDEIDE